MEIRNTINAQKWCWKWGRSILGSNIAHIFKSISIKLCPICETESHFKPNLTVYWLLNINYVSYN